MGNVSSGNKDIDIFSTVNLVASDLILKQTLDDMKNLNNSEYCDKLVVITSNVLNKKFSGKEISYINSQIYGDNIVNKEVKDELKYVLKDKIDNLDIKNKVNKMSACKSIAKFYIKLANLWYAIVSTIKPPDTDNYKRLSQRDLIDDNYDNYDNSNKLASSEYTDREDIAKKRLIAQDSMKDDIRKLIARDSMGAEKELMRRNMSDERRMLMENDYVMRGGDEMRESNFKQNVNFCDNRINILNSLLKDTDDGYKLNKNNLCKFKSYNLMKEPGIPELENLYFDEYDSETGNLTKMSKKNKLMYERDLKTFYNELVGKTLPKSIKRFSDINVNNIENPEECGREYNNDLNKSLNESVLLNKSNVSEEIFKRYGNAFNKLVLNSRLRRNQLVKIIDKLFISNNIPSTNKLEIIINPKLTSKILDNLINNARNIIINIYINCDKDFKDVNKIYNIIIDNYFPIRNKINDSNKNSNKDRYYKYLENNYI